MEDTEKPTFTTEELNEMFRKGESCDEDYFSEVKGNILLTSGKHYAKKASNFVNRRIFNDLDLNKENKIRLTRNHIQKIQDTQLNGLMSFCPDIAISPANGNELTDVKSAEMHRSVWKYINKKHKLRSKKQKWGKRYLDLGETFVKVSFDPNLGVKVGQEPVFGDEADPFTGEPIQIGVKDVVSGDLIFEEHFAFNVLRDSSADSIEESPWLCIRKLMPKKELIKQLREQGLEDKIKEITDASQGSNDTYRVFDAVAGEYRDLKGQILLREWYFRPSSKYPTGWYIYDTQSAKVSEGPLPEGIYPIKYCGYKEVETSARCISLIRTLRPYQVEINRMASKIAEHQITVGDDKVVVEGNGKMSYAGQFPGVRQYNVIGGRTSIVPGRAGDQFLPHIEATVAEMYSVAPYQEWKEEKNIQDPYAMLYASARNRLRFSIYAEKFEDFYLDVAETALRLVKLYAHPMFVIKNTGMGDSVNMAEFKKTDDLSYQISIDRSSGDLDSMMGKQLNLNQLVQYGGDKLNREDFGNIARNMPYLQDEELFSDLTLDYDSVKNTMLALDRGENVAVNRYDNHEYIIKKLIARTKKPDFKFLPEQAQSNYMSLIQEHEMVQAQILEDLKRQEAGFYPMTGLPVKIEVKGPDGKYIAVPYDAVQKFLEHITKQGFVTNPLYEVGPQVAAETLQMANQGSMQPNQAPQPPVGMANPPPV